MRGQRETRPCAGCGKKLTKLLSQAPAANWFCSRQCQTSHAPPAAKSFNPYCGQRETRPCAECGTSVTRYLRPANKDQVWTCSRGCMGHNQALKQLADGTWTQPKKPRGGDTIPCDVCGTPFYRQPIHVARDRRYCSQPCWNQAQRADRTIKTCAYCGADFPVRPSEMNIATCSRACMASLKIKRPTGRVHNGRPVLETLHGYLAVYEPDHPAAHKHNGRVLEHRLVMEKKIGRYLTPKETVNHIDHDPSNNAPENLEILSPSDHSKETNAHARAAREAMKTRLAEYERRFGPLEQPR